MLPRVLVSGRVIMPGGVEVDPDDPTWIAYRASGAAYTRDIPSLEWTPADELRAAAEWGAKLVDDVAAVQLASGVNAVPGMALGLARLFAEPQRLLREGHLHAAYDSITELMAPPGLPIEAQSIAGYVMGELRARLGGDR